VSWAQESRLLSWLGLQDGMSVLELGSGPGFVTEQLLSLLPRGSITAVEIDPEMNERARERLSDGARERVTHLQASILDTGLPGDSFDFAVARLVFQHLDDPAAAAAETLRLLKPGGRLAVIEVDASLWGIVEPSMPGLQRVYEKVARAQAARGGDRLIGRRLWRILKAAGYENLRLEAYVYHSDELGLEAFAAQLNPDRLWPQVKDGSISLSELAAVRMAYEKFLSSTDAYILMLGLMCVGEKPLQQGSVNNEDSSSPQDEATAVAPGGTGKRIEQGRGDDGRRN
jgi:ubiquinone/menaquinone biosynthesis C-methylase UbiE